MVMLAEGCGSSWRPNLFWYMMLLSLKKNFFCRPLIKTDTTQGMPSALFPFGISEMSFREQKPFTSMS